jgi:hypothetical protein
MVKNLSRKILIQLGGSTAEEKVEQIWQRIVDFPTYPAIMPAVEKVSKLGEGPGWSIHRWEADSDGTPIIWVEREEYQKNELRIKFSRWPQLEDVDSKGILTNKARFAELTCLPEAAKKTAARDNDFRIYNGYWDLDVVQVRIEVVVENGEEVRIGIVDVNGEETWIQVELYTLFDLGLDELDRLIGATLLQQFGDNAEMMLESIKTAVATK